MTEKITHRFVADVDGTSKTLLSVAVRKNGDLVMDLKSADKYTDIDIHKDQPGFTELHNKTVLNQKYSVHTSNKSKTNINVIKQTFLFEDGTEHVFNYHFTKALKQTNLFAPIYMRLFPNLSAEKYDTPEDDGTNISIGKFDTKKFTLFGGVFIAHKSRFFEMYRNCKFGICQVVAGDYRVVLLYSFSPFPAFDHGYLHHFTTFDEKSEISKSSIFVQAYSEAVANGFNEMEAVVAYMEQLSEFRKQMLTLIGKTHGVLNSHHFDLIDHNDFIFSKSDISAVSTRIKQHSRDSRVAAIINNMRNSR